MCVNVRWVLQVFTLESDRAYDFKGVHRAWQQTRCQIPVFAWRSTPPSKYLSFSTSDFADAHDGGRFHCRDGRIRGSGYFCVWSTRRCLHMLTVFFFLLMIVSRFM